MASGSQIESGTTTRPRRQVIGEEACGEEVGGMEVCAAFAAMALPVDDSDEQTTVTNNLQDRATLPMYRSTRHDAA